MKRKYVFWSIIVCFEIDTFLLFAWLRTQHESSHIEKQTIEIRNKWFVFWKQCNEKTKQAKNKTSKKQNNFQFTTQKQRIVWKQQSNNNYETKHEQIPLNIELNWFEHFSCWKKNLYKKREMLN